MAEAIYQGEMAEWYDDVYARPDDGSVEMLGRIMSDRGCKSVLEVGCGTGRVAVRLAEMGYDVAGIDNSEDMLKRARSKGSNVEFFHGDMRSFRSGRKFDCAVLMDSCFSYMRTNDDCLAALSSVAACLKKGGIIVIEEQNVWPEVAEKGSDRDWTEVSGSNGRTLKITNRTEIDPIDAVIYQTSKYEGKSASGSLSFEDKEPVAMRILTPSQIDLMFRLTGFKNPAFYGDFKMNPLSKDNCDWMVVVGEKA